MDYSQDRVLPGPPLADSSEKDIKVSEFVEHVLEVLKPYGMIRAKRMFGSRSPGATDRDLADRTRQ